jgi:hypothetical protein
MCKIKSATGLGHFSVFHMRSFGRSDRRSSRMTVHLYATYKKHWKIAGRRMYFVLLHCRSAELSLSFFNTLTLWCSRSFSISSWSENPPTASLAPYSLLCKGRHSTTQERDSIRKDPHTGSDSISHTRGGSRSKGLHLQETCRLRFAPPYQ